MLTTTSTSRRIRIAGLAALATAVSAVGVLGAVPQAQADPAPEQDSTVLDVGDFEISPAPGSCAALVTIEGANGGTAVSGGDDDDNPGEDDPDQLGGGQGARIQFRVPLSATDELTGVVGTGGSGGGIGGSSGDDKGGDGGTGTHRGAGGGGYTSFLVNGTLVALAGGGGGSGGGHNPDAGGGGHAGVVEGAGTWAGQEGAAGNDNALDGGAPGGGAAGGTTAPGAAGVHATQPDFNGSPGSGRNGGQGGADGSADQGGGGGAGYYGGGGGASTVGNVNGGNGRIIGGGGGGGSSYFAAAEGATFIVPADDAGEALAENKASRNGTAEIEWVPCDYDLSITKTAAAEVFESGTPVTYTLTITNHGPQAMGIDDTVTVTDDKGAGGTLVAVRSSGSGAAFTCDTEIGAKIPSGGEIDCSRPVGDNVRGLGNGETLTLVYTQILTGNAPVENKVSVTDRGNPANNAAAATVQPAVPGLSLVKKAKPKKVSRIGEKIKYTFTVTNTGNIALTTVGIAEQQFSGKGTLTPVCPVLPTTGLAPGNSIVCTAKYKAHKRDLVAGKVTNVAIATGTTPAGNPVQSLPSKAKVKTPKIAKVKGANVSKTPKGKKLPGTPKTGARVAAGR